MAIEKFPVEAGAIMLFARAIGDTNPAYYTLDENAIAPPTYVQSGAQYDSEYPLRPVIGEPWVGSGKEATGVPPEQLTRVRGGLHAEQHFEYHRHPKPGDVLSATVTPGKTWEKEGKRGGKLKFSESIAEYRDQKGELVVTARSIAVVTERPATQG